VIAAEWVRQWRRPRTLILMAATAVFPLIIVVALTATGSGQVERVGDIPLLIVPRTSGLSVPVIALSSTMRFFLPLAIAVVAGEAVAGEARAGRLRYVLAGPQSRGRYLASRAGVAGSISLGLIMIFMVAATGSGLAAFGWHPFSALNGNQAAINSISRFTAPDSLAKLAVGTVYVAAGMASIFAFAFLVSTLTTRPFVAVAAGAALSVASRVFNADYLPGVSAISRWMPNNDIDLWQHLFANPPDSSGMGRFLLLQAGYVAVFFLIAWQLFVRRDVLS
jgi:ABC-2 type transport system permease protein